MRTALLLLLAGIFGIFGGFLVPGGLGLALVLGGSVLLWLGTLATLKHIG